MAGISASKIVTEDFSDCMNSEQRICEMVVDNMEINVPIDNRIDIDTILADDPDPKFVNVEVLRAGISKGNRRRYNNNSVKEVSDMIAGCQGFFGHPDPSKHGFEFREPQCIYVGSFIEHMVDGIDRCIAKAYLFKTSPLREWIPKSIAAGNPMTVSINGTGDIMRNGDILDVIHMRDLQSIDWANPGTEGMGTSKAMSVVREMEEKEGGSKMEGTNVQDIIKNVTVTEFKAFNPVGYDSILKGITIAELNAVNPALVEEIKKASTITELSVVRGGKEEKMPVTGLQAIVDQYESKITELSDEIETSKITEYKNSQIAELIPENLREKISGRVTGKTKEEIDASIQTEIGYVREMGIDVNTPAPTDKRKPGNVDVKDSVKKMFSMSK